MFVCTGNTCRSPMAAAVCNALASARSLHVKASSAGLFARDGAPATREAVLVLAEKGISLHHVARKLTPEIAQSVDLIVPLTPEHRGYMLQTIPGINENRVVCMQTPIKDPFGGNLQVYRDTLTEIVYEVDALLNTWEETAKVTIEPMESKHLDEVSRLEKNCFSDPWKKESLRELLFHPHVKAIVATKGEKVAGYLFLFYDHVEATIGNLAVSPHYRGYGMGETLMRFILDEMRERGVQYITLEVRSKNKAAIALYEKLGFALVGIRKNYYDIPTDDAYVMKLLFT